MGSNWSLTSGWISASLPSLSSSVSESGPEVVDHRGGERERERAGERAGERERERDHERAGERLRKRLLPPYCS